MTDAVKMAVGVTRDDAVKFLEQACRNWRHVPKLSNEDITDVMVALAVFARKANPADPTCNDSLQVAAPVKQSLTTEQAGEPVADFYYPIEMPLNADGHGPATVGEDATTMTFEVWDQFCDSHGRFARLSDAIQRARQLNALPTLQRLGQEFDAGEGHRLAHAWLDENFSDVPDADFSAADMERAFLAGLAQSRGQAFDGEGEALSIAGKIPISEFPGKSYADKLDNAAKVIAALSSAKRGEEG
ncbi:hypothetical protein [Sphingobium yanoikuyae]|uniref:hypothetical protein n=1 Tax=Sphingobium yanoikuyae TaxID=13690 RepID=UPI0028A5B5F9|nr:hypothetical protein [Sphingobium yanoikuyae]